MRLLLKIYAFITISDWYSRRMFFVFCFWLTDGAFLYSETSTENKHSMTACYANWTRMKVYVWIRNELNYLFNHTNIVMYWVSILPVENEDASWENVWQRRSSYFFLFEKIVVHFVVEHCSFNKFHDFFSLLNKQTWFTFFFFLKKIVVYFVVEHELLF